MSDFKDTNLVVQANYLIQQANWKMNAIPLKIFKVLISCIDTKNPPKDNKVTITKKELYDLLGSEVSPGSYDQLKKAVKSLQKQIVEIRKEDGSIVSLSVLPYVTWEADSENVICEFGRDLMPYLIELKEHFTQYPVINLKMFDSKYGLILYEWIKSKTYDTTSAIITLDDLRKLTGTEKKYADFRNFEKRVLKPAKDDINQGGLEFLVDYEKIKKGTKIEKIIFRIKKRQSWRENEFEYGEPAVDPDQMTIDDYY